MLLTRKEEKMVSDYYNGKLTEEEMQAVRDWDEECSKISGGKHALKMPLTSEQEDLLERCRQHNLTAEEKKQALQLNEEYNNYCWGYCLTPDMRDYCHSED